MGCRGRMYRAFFVSMCVCRGYLSCSPQCISITSTSLRLVDSKLQHSCSHWRMYRGKVVGVFEIYILADDEYQALKRNWVERVYRYMHINDQYPEFDFCLETAIEYFLTQWVKRNLDQFELLHQVIVWRCRNIWIPKTCSCLNKILLTCFNKFHLCLSLSGVPNVY